MPISRARRFGVNSPAHMCCGCTHVCLSFIALRFASLDCPLPIPAGWPCRRPASPACTVCFLFPPHGPTLVVSRARVGLGWMYMPAVDVEIHYYLLCIRGVLPDRLGHVTILRVFGRDLPFRRTGAA